MVETFTDFFGNKAGVFTILKPHTELVIQSTIEIDRQSFAAYPIVLLLKGNPLVE